MYTIQGLFDNNNFVVSGSSKADCEEQIRISNEQKAAILGAAVKGLNWLFSGLSNAVQSGSTRSEDVSSSSSYSSADLRNLAESIYSFGGGYYAHKIGNSDLRNLAESIHDYSSGYYAHKIGNSDLRNLAESIHDYSSGYYAHKIGNSDLRNLAESINDYGGGYYAHKIGK